MADIMLNKVINAELSMDLLLKWLTQGRHKVEQIDAYNVTQIDFITYFLNFVHEDISSENNCLDICDKTRGNNTPKRIKRGTKITHEPNYSSKRNLFSDKKPRNDRQDIESGTPKANNAAGPQKEACYFSPISPLYQNPNDVNVSVDVKKPTEKFSLCLGDFIVNQKNSKKKKINLECNDTKKEVSRRIKPTNVCVRQLSSGFENVENSFNFQDNDGEVDVSSVVEQRNLLIEEKDKILSNRERTENKISLLSKRQRILTHAEIKRSLTDVTFKKEIEYIVEIYKFAMNNNYVLNITSEIYFLITLLTSNRKDFLSKSQNALEENNLGVHYLDSTMKNDTLETRIYNTQIFESAHNVIYFAIKCLETQINIIKLYDRTTIELLANNNDIKQLSSSFSKKLLSLAERKIDSPDSDIITPITQTNVCFDIDTDNKANFPTEKSFHAFRKQRDLFYEILRIWEQQHLTADWSYSFGLGGKIRTLFSLSSDPISYVHLARLFKNQLLTNCGKGSKEKGLSENTAVPQSLLIDQDKLNRLTNRLVTKQSSNGRNSFSGYQEFYKEFILIAANHFFNKHLCDALVNDIIDLNKSKFWESDWEKGKDVNSETRKQYVSCIRNLRMLAKFLGFIESLPYKLDYAPKDNVLEAQIKVRSQFVPILDIKTLLQSAMSNKTLILLIPWLSKYLTMLDYITLRLPYYISVYQFLFSIYSNSSHFLPSYNEAVLKFSLGWLFELPDFPDHEYYNFRSRAKFDEETKISRNLTNGKHLDNMRIVSQKVLYICCPFLEENQIKKMLLTTCSSGKAAVKFITPVTAVESDQSRFIKKLENQLEEAFFNAHPSSLRKTAEFVSERVASAIVKHICNDMMPNSKNKLLEDFKVLKQSCMTDSLDMDNLQQKLNKQAMPFVQNYVKEFLTTSEPILSNLAEKQISTALSGLLTLDALEEMKNTCILFTLRMCMERVKNWITTHITVSVFMKCLESEITKVGNGKKSEKEKPVFSLPPTGRDCLHNEDAPYGWSVLNELQDVCCEVIEGKQIREEDIIKISKRIYQSLTERNDVNDGLASVIQATLFDLCMVLVANIPEAFNNTDILNTFSLVWKLQTPNLIFKSLFCPKTVTLLQISAPQSKSWNCYAKIIAYLVRNRLIEENELEFQCTSFYNRDWDEDTLANFSEFLKLFLTYSMCDNLNSKFAMLLDFLSDFCADL